MNPYQQCITVTAVNLCHAVLQKQLNSFGLYFSKKNATAEYWVSWSVAFCIKSHSELADYYILECHMVKLVTH